MREMKSVEKAPKQNVGFPMKTRLYKKRKRERPTTGGGTTAVRSSLASSLYGSLLLQLRSRNKALKLNEICCDDTSVIDLRYEFSVANFVST
ncbi:hypothetical protein Hdeb2414_s0137g00809251 [Helianthus debilis subsp. tardiflorus]